MTMTVGIPKETRAYETRVSATPDSVKKLLKKGLKVRLEKSAGALSGFLDSDYQNVGGEIVDAAAALSADIVLKVNRPDLSEVFRMKKGGLLISFLEPDLSDGLLEKVAAVGINAMSMELIPRTSRAQSMDALSSQANIAGYRAVLEAAAHYRRFFPMMMTAAGSAKPARVVVLGAGVAGLQAIGTARRLGAQVEAYDVRPEVKEQIQSLGAKFIEISVGEEGTGAGGYARELSEAGKKQQQELLAEKLKKADIIISTANVPGRKAPILIPEETVREMRTGSVIVDMAAPSGGNCPLTEPDQVVVKHGVTLIGLKGLAARVPSDASSFYARNVTHLLELVLASQGDGSPSLNFRLDDDIVAASLVTYQGTVRLGQKGVS